VAGPEAAGAAFGGVHRSVRVPQELVWGVGVGRGQADPDARPDAHVLVGDQEGRAEGGEQVLGDAFGDPGRQARGQVGE